MAKQARQYTIRNVPAAVDRALRRRARQLGLSMNRVALEALAAGAGAPLVQKRDLSGIVGSLEADDAARLDEEVLRQRSIDPELWR